VWDPKEGQWEVEVEDLETGKTVIDRGEILINATGFLKYGKPLFNISFYSLCI